MTSDFDSSDTSTVDREGQYDEFVTLLARHDQTIRRYTRTLMPTSDGVDDVVQETALECWKKFADFRPESSESAGEEFVRWACVIARYKAMSWQRDRSRDRLVFRESVIEALSEAAAATLEQRSEHRTAVEQCLRRLSVDDRRLVLSVHAPGDSVARIAQESGQRARQLYSKVNTLRTRLLACVEQRLAGELGHG